jgi:hypothetical protein
MAMFVWQGNLKCDLGISHQRQVPPRASHQQSHPPLGQPHSAHCKSCTDTLKPDGCIPAAALKDLPQETDSKDDGLEGRIHQHYSPDQESNTGEANPEETPMDKENPYIEGHPTAGGTFSDDPDYN